MSDELAERKVITVLFADVDEPVPAECGTRDLEDISAMLSAHLDQVRGQVVRFGGTVEHAVGSTIMAVFGLPKLHEDDPERAVRAALAIRAALLEPTARAGASGRQQIQLRISVVTGEALLETHNGETRIAGDLIGTGALLQQAAPPGTIMVSEATERATARAINYGPPSLLSLRGRAKPVIIWSALEPRNPSAP